MSSQEHNLRKQGPRVHNTGPVLKEHSIITFTRKALTLLISAALVLAEIPGFGS
jgi:hypothetical protein